MWSRAALGMAVLVSAATVCVPAQATKRARGLRPDVELGGRAAAGIVHGGGVRRFDALVVEAELRAEPSLAWKRLELALPLSLRHSEPMGVHLRETRAQAGLELDWRPTKKFRPFAEVRVVGVWRPDWPDLYQPDADGTLRSTSRHSYTKREAGFGFAAIPLRHHHARVKYGYTLVVYQQDPNFEAVARPTHLVPDDHDEHRIVVSWRYLTPAWKPKLAVELYQRNYFFEFARDAGNGRTHAAPGGLDPNPLYRTRGVRPELSLKVDLSKEVTLRPEYGLELLQDEFQGYYSFVEHQPGIGLDAELSPRWSLELDYGQRWRRYGENSYAAGTNHPPLTYGSRRVDRRELAKLSLGFELLPSWLATLDVRASVRRTNFPPYQPGVFPAGRTYDIDWNYENWRVMLGVEYR